MGIYICVGGKYGEEGGTAGEGKGRGVEGKEGVKKKEKGGEREGKTFPLLWFYNLTTTPSAIDSQSPLIAKPGSAPVEEPIALTACHYWPLPLVLFHVIGGKQIWMLCCITVYGVIFNFNHLEWVKGFVNNFGKWLCAINFLTCSGSVFQETTVLCATLKQVSVIQIVVTLFRDISVPFFGKHSIRYFGKWKLPFFTLQIFTNLMTVVITTMALRDICGVAL